MSNPYKYGSIEYKLFKTREAIDEAIESAKNFRSEQKAIVKVNSIHFGSGWLEKDRIQAPKRMESYFDTRNNWRRFDENNTAHIEEAFNACLKHCDAAEAEIERWHQENLPAIENNNAAKQAIINYMELVGVPKTQFVSEKVSRKKDLVSVERPAGFVMDLARLCKIDDGYETSKETFQKQRRQAKEWRDRLIAVIEKNKKEKEKTDAQLRLIAKSMELAATWGIEFSNNDELISKVQRRAEEEKAKEYGGEWDDFDFTGDVITGIKGWEID